MAETPSSVVLVPKPLSVKAMALRRPELYMERSVEYAEEGDILFPKQQVDNDKGLYWGPTTGLCYPIAVPSALVGEMFRASLIFRNCASYPLTKLHVKIELVTPGTVSTQAQRVVLSDSQKTAEIKPYGHFDLKIETRLRDPGAHTMSIVAMVTDVIGEKRTLPLAFKIPVEIAFEEVERQVIFIKKPPPASSSIASKGQYQQQNVLVVFAIRNVSKVPLTLNHVKFDPKDSATALYQLVNNSTIAGQQDLPFQYRYTGAGRDDLADMHVMPGDRRQFLFELTPRDVDIGGNFKSSHSSQSQTANVAQAMKQFNTELGHVVWSWHRGNGDGGSDRSTMIECSRPPAAPEVDLQLSIVPKSPMAAAPSAANISLGQTGVLPYKPCTVHLRVINYSEGRKRDVMLLVEPQALLKANWMYSGSCSRLLGIADGSGGELVSTFTLTPMRSGILAVPTAGFQLRDATRPDVVLWPPGNASIGATLAEVYVE